MAGYEHIATPQWVDVTEIALNDKIGPTENGGVTTIPHQELTDRTEFLKDQIDTHVANPAAHNATYVATPSRIARRDASGNFRVGAPVEDDDILRKIDIGLLAAPKGFLVKGACTSDVRNEAKNSLTGPYVHAGADLAVFSLPGHSYQPGHYITALISGGTLPAAVYKVVSISGNDVTVQATGVAATSGNITVNNVLPGDHGVNVYDVAWWVADPYYGDIGMMVNWLIPITTDLDYPGGDARGTRVSTVLFFDAYNWTTTAVYFLGV